MDVAQVIINFLDLMILELHNFYLSSEMVNNKTHIVVN